MYIVTVCFSSKLPTIKSVMDFFSSSAQTGKNAFQVSSMLHLIYESIYHAYITYTFVQILLSCDVLRRSSNPVFREFNMYLSKSMII